MRLVQNLKCGTSQQMIWTHTGFIYFELNPYVTQLRVKDNSCSIRRITKNGLFILSSSVVLSLPYSNELFHFSVEIHMRAILIAEVTHGWNHEKIKKTEHTQFAWGHHGLGNVGFYMDSFSSFIFAFTFLWRQWQAIEKYASARQRILHPNPWVLLHTSHEMLLHTSHEMFVTEMRASWLKCAPEYFLLCWWLCLYVLLNMLYRMIPWVCEFSSGYQIIPGKHSYDYYYVATNRAGVSMNCWLHGFVLLLR
jgi:hypothetical protein